MYWNTVVGDSPELARGLYLFGFADLECSMTFHQAITTRYANNDPAKFSFGTPRQVSKSMTLCWKVEPTSNRVIQDILDLPRVLKKIVEVKGSGARRSTP